MLSPPQERRFLLVLACVQFTHILDFMVMMPLGPQIIAKLGLAPHDFGLLVSSYTFAAAISGLAAAFYVDRLERRGLILSLYFAFALATLACALAPSYGFLLLARALAGCFGGILSALIQTLIADAIPFQRRGKAVGTVMAAFSVSTVAGVPISLLLSDLLPDLNWRAPFLAIAVTSLMVCALAARTLPRMDHHLQHESPENRLQVVWNLLRAPITRKACLLMGALMLSGFLVIPYIALYLTSNAGLPYRHLSLVYLFGGVATLVSSRTIGHWADRHGKRGTLQWVTLASFVPILGLTNLGPSPLWLVLLAGTTFFVFVSGRIIPAMALVGELVLPRHRGTFMSMIGSVQMMSSGLASVVAGHIIQDTGDGHILHYDWVGVLAMACGLLAIWLVRHIPDRVGVPEDPPRGVA